MSATCRFCREQLHHVFADLGVQPLANSFLADDELGRMEPHYPLRALVCERCFLVQLEEFEAPRAIFSDYAYFSSFSDTWLRHAESFADHAVQRFGLDRSSRVVEVGSNDGYLLQHFVARGIEGLGIEPAANVAAAARERGVPTLVEFFGVETARRVREQAPADLLIGNNVLAHVPDLNDFVAGLKLLLAPGGTITLEFPHLLRLMEEAQFDTIYHEHFSYFSFLTARDVLARHGLALVDVDELPTHGGSLRIYAGHREQAERESAAVVELAERERKVSLRQLDTYLEFAARVRREKRDILAFLIRAKGEGRSIVGYGAPAKGNTLLNYCGVGTDFVDYTVDRNPYKQGRYLPGSRIPIRAPEEIARTRPDLLLILPWNLREEIIGQMAFIREWGGRFVARAPALTVFP